MTEQYMMYLLSLSYRSPVCSDMDPQSPLRRTGTGIQKYLFWEMQRGILDLRFSRLLQVEFFISASASIYFNGCYGSSCALYVPGVSHPHLLPSATATAAGAGVGESRRGSILADLSVPSEGGGPASRCRDLSKADRSLLERAKWLVSRYCPDSGKGGGLGVPNSDRVRNDEDETQDGKEAIDRGIEGDLIPRISRVAEHIRTEQLMSEFSGDWELQQLATKEGRATARASCMLLSFVDFLSEVTHHILHFDMT